MASKSGQPEADKVDIEEALDYVDKTLDRTKVLYEQYFLGMQKQPPTQIHTDVERRLRDLQQMQIRNTGLRYRFATLQQKFGSYNSYWRRTLKQIENGTYIRNLQKISRKAALTGEAIPEEILAAMPKRMREQVKRDREQALSIANRRRQDEGVSEDMLGDEPAEIIAAAPEGVRQAQAQRGGRHVLDESEDVDFEAFFASVSEDRSEDTQPNAQIPQPEPRAAAQVRPSAPAARPSAPAIRPSAPAVRPIMAMDDDDEATTFEPPSHTPPPRATGPLPVQQSRGTGSVPAAGPRATTQLEPTSGAQHPRASTQPGTAAPRPGAPPPVPQRPSGAIPTIPGQPSQRATGPMPTIPGQPPQRATGPMPTIPGQPAQRATGPIPTQAPQHATGPIPAQAPQRATGPVPTAPANRPSVPAPVRQTGPVPVVPAPAGTRAATGPVPVVPAPGQSGGHPAVPRPGIPSGGVPRPGGAPAPSQVSRPNPIAPGSSIARPAVPVESMSGPFPRAPAPPVNARPEAPKVAPLKPAAAPPRPPPGMNDADVNALYATYVKAKKAVGEEAGPGSYGKLLQTINAQAPKIMEQYKAKGVEFSVVVKDNQVVIKAKPKT